MSDSRHRTMKAVRWEGKPFSVSVRDVPIPKIRHSLDAIVHLTTSAVCGSDLHAYHGRWDLEPEILGHENIGIVVEVGDDVTVIKKGDRVVVNADIEEPFDTKTPKIAVPTVLARSGCLINGMVARQSICESRGHPTI